MQTELDAQFPTFIKTLLLILMTGFLLSVSVGLLLYINQENSVEPFFYILLCLTVSGTILVAYKLLRENYVQSYIQMPSGIVIACVIAIITMVCLVNIQQTTVSLQELFLLALVSAACGMPFASILKRLEVSSEN